MNHRQPNHAGALLSIDLDAICDNWRMLKGRLAAGSECGAVVKADAYSLGALRVAPALYEAGCRQFFVAHLDEGIALRPALPRDATVYVLHGSPSGAESEFVDHDLVPVMNSLPQVASWRMLTRRLDRKLPAVLQIDTGMARLGLSDEELKRVSEDVDGLRGFDLRFVMSHLVSAEDHSSPINGAQLQQFSAALRRFAPARASLSNSSGIFLGSAYHFDLVRPGAALYGVAPVAGQPNPLRPVVRLQGRVIQTRAIEAGAGVGYGHAWSAAKRSRIATVAAGYADGYLRSLSNRGYAHFEGTRLPIVGRVSMDTVLIDVSDVAEGAIHADSLIDLIGPDNSVDDIAERAGTIGYEILTSLGNRYARSYISNAGDRPSAAPFAHR